MNQPRVLLRPVRKGLLVSVGLMNSYVDRTRPARPTNYDVRLRSLRQRKHLTQTALARRIGAGGKVLACM